MIKEQTRVAKLLKEYDMFNYINDFYENKDVKELNPNDNDQILDHCQITKIGSNFHVQSVDLELKEDYETVLMDLKSKETDEKELTDQEFKDELRRNDKDLMMKNMMNTFLSFKQTLQVQRSGYDIEMQKKTSKLSRRWQIKMDYLW